ncbi:hypothetical protein BDR07DRAFT_1432956, partial [Suillus spraguei]
MINRQDPTVLTQERRYASLASFLILIPIILTTERDTRVINVVNPFYTAAAPSYSPISTSPQTSPLFHKEVGAPIKLLSSLATFSVSL